jgi:tRNA G18 (ribose-2'-O)-methylase SpoU
MERIESLDDPRIAPYRNLRDRTLRGESIFVTEGPIVTRRLLASRYQADSVLVAEHFADQFDLLAAGKAPLYVAHAALLRQIVGFPFHLGVLAAGRRPEPARLDDLLRGKETAPELTLLLCPEITKPENVGLVFRTAAAFGIDGVLLGARSCDPLSRRSLRVSMGGALQVPFVRSPDFAADLRRLKHPWHFELIAAVVDQSAERLPEVHWPPRAGIVLGNEVAGVDPLTLSLCDRRATIPMQPGMDSLNLGTAAAIFVYQRKRAFGLPISESPGRR